MADDGKKGHAEEDNEEDDENEDDGEKDEEKPIKKPAVKKAKKTQTSRPRTVAGLTDYLAAQQQAIVNAKSLIQKLSRWPVKLYNLGEISSSLVQSFGLTYYADAMEKLSLDDLETVKGVLSANTTELVHGEQESEVQQSRLRRVM
jgi:hypothetical protein